MISARDGESEHALDSAVAPNGSHKRRTGQHTFFFEFLAHERDIDELKRAGAQSELFHLHRRLIEATARDERAVAFKASSFPYALLQLRTHSGSGTSNKTAAHRFVDAVNIAPFGLALNSPEISAVMMRFQPAGPARHWKATQSY